MRRADAEQAAVVIEEASPGTVGPTGCVHRGGSRRTLGAAPQAEEPCRVIGGDRPWDLRVHDERLDTRVLLGGSPALGESYMDGWWDSERLDQFFHRILRTGLDGKVRRWVEPLRALGAVLFNLQEPSRAFQVGRRHYDIGNDPYRRMLGERMIYSCGYWRNASTLDEAQEAKLDLVCRKLHLRPGMRILDIGCGWGGTAKFAAERYGVSVVGITISREQSELAKRTCKDLDVEIRLQDYRDVAGEFDRILSIGMSGGITTAASSLSPGGT